MTLFAIDARLNRTGVDKSKGFPDGWLSSREVPTFIIDSRIQGSLNEASAAQIARSVLDPLGLESPEHRWAITAVQLDEGPYYEFTNAELDYLARCVDLGRGDDRARAYLQPTERDTLLRKLGGRRNFEEPQ